NREAERVYGAEDSVGYELAGHAALFFGDYKLVFNRGPVGDNQWRLFNIVTDPGESTDLSKVEPDLLQRMLALYRQYEQDNDVAPIPAGFSSTRQLLYNGLRDRFGTQILIFILTVLIILPFYAVYRINQSVKAEPLSLS
ncbi:MAG: arylsulfatase, partial [Pseudomonadota bacterium]